jgi:hypothetical protein
MKLIHASALLEKIAVPLAIALVTGTSTVTFLNVLMPSVWCMKVNTDSSYQVLYGNQNCPIRVGR